MNKSERIHVFDSHTGGEPTRVVLAGGPPLGHGPLDERLVTFRESYDYFRSAMVKEPRGSDAVVGALLCEPSDRSCAAGVIFFNNVGYLGMCGHGSIGVITTLAYLGRITAGVHRLETPVGVVKAHLHHNGEVTVNNVRSYRWQAGVAVDAGSYGRVKGDVAWGGNWFFLTDRSPTALTLANVDELTEYCWAIRQALNDEGCTGAGGQEIDHIEVSGPPTLPGAHSKNFVLCPGKSYDRSPCGTGTSAKLACLYADGMLREGEVWRQQSITDSVFEGSIAVTDGAVMPSIKGSAWINAESYLILDERDPLCWGIRPPLRTEEA